MRQPEPNAEDFPTLAAYSEAWYRWRALCRDRELNTQERAAQSAVIDQALAARHGGPPT